MTGLVLEAVCFDAHDPAAQARFWAGVLGGRVVEGADCVDLVPTDDPGFRVRFRASSESKSGPNQMHFDLTSSSLDDQQATVARALDLGARHLDVGQTGEEGHVVLADPEGNELCVIEADNDFLAGTGFIGALASDGTQAVGYFWSRALAWPLVWDQDQETAVQSPRGGPKITWGGPPVAPLSTGRRIRFELAASYDEEAEVERLVALGATRLGAEGEWVLLSDPDGNELRVRRARVGSPS